MSKKKKKPDRRNALIKIVGSKERKLKINTDFYRRSGCPKVGRGGDPLIISSFFTLRAMVFLACENSRFSSLLAARDVSRFIQEKQYCDEARV